MRRLVAVAVCVCVVSVLATPAGVWAARGGNGNAVGHDHAPGQAKNDSPAPTPSYPLATAQEPAVHPEPGPADRVKEGKGRNGEAIGRLETVDEHASDDGTPTATVRDRLRIRESEEGSSGVKPTQTGVANAFDHIASNIAAQESKVDAGSKRKLSPGLIRVFEKFYSWLGLTPEYTPEDTATPIPPQESPIPMPTP